MKTKMKHANIPVFIPHLGCPNQCVFCNQRTISGTCSFIEGDVSRLISDSLDTIGDRECEIAFFGGSFTGIDRGLMIRMLDTAEREVKAGRIAGIRMSTRPDYITEEILDILDRYTVSQVELGIQSMTDSVLAASKRGHTADDTRRACALLGARGYSFVGQMMVGLPTATCVDEVNCARIICEMGADGARVYPTVVFRDTELADMTERGEYLPLTLDGAVARTAAALSVFDGHGVPCIRVGLCDSENLHSDETYVAGPNHSAVGELARGHLFFLSMCDQLDGAGDVRGKDVRFFVAPGTVSMAVGQRKMNVTEIKNKYGVKSVKILENAEILRYNISLDI